MSDRTLSHRSNKQRRHTLPRFGTRGGSIIEYIMIAGIVALAAIHGFKQAQMRENRAIAQQARIIRTLDPEHPSGADFGDPEFGSDDDAPFCNLQGVCNCKKQCFAKGTLVATDGGLVAIETLKEGDLIWSRDEASGDLALRPVLHKFETPAQPVMELNVAAGKETETIRATTGHPFWTPNRGWVRADELATNDALFSAAGDSAHVLPISNSGISRETVYNLEIAEFHTYFVGHHGIWVHNAGPGGPGAPGAPCPNQGGGGTVDPTQLPPPGTCTQTQYDKLRAEVVKTKHDVGQLGGCKAADSPELLQKKADAWKAQAIARNTLDVTCFGGGNDGHQQASAAAWEQWGKCKGMGAH